MSTSCLTPEEARKTWACPVARIFAEKKGPNCMADECPLWRWEPRDWANPPLRLAVQKEIQRIATERGKTASGVYHKQAVANIVADPAAHGVDLEPDRGWCGLGGKPLA